ncbi:flavin reductase family protein [Mesorhizobium sp. CO1-1-8]|uniref:flavin reductase family protein n=1 Tax=Mesorhizobium sp. CO1-1-8 TaxID=2876631 RepID=UPI001CD161E9|nr:flavin reductase family protein [Mesorhizobium sp. CO1-1-8]MBZ9772437.1 flavin reductase family protein [Mesorhizobium sp. CO1-1-8]
MTFDDIADSKRYWQMLGRRPTAVPVITSRDEGGPAGFLALSVAHVTSSPPSMSVAVAKSTSALATIRNSGLFAINYLPSHAAGTADIFGGRSGLNGAERFAANDWDLIGSGPPKFRYALLIINCTVDKIFTYHETEIVIGRLVDCVAEEDATPLLSFRGKYVGWSGSADQGEMNTISPLAG